MPLLAPLASRSGHSVCSICAASIVSVDAINAAVIIAIRLLIRVCIFALRCSAVTSALLYFYFCSVYFCSASLRVPPAGRSPVATVRVATQARAAGQQAWASTQGNWQGTGEPRLLLYIYSCRWLFMFMYISSICSFVLLVCLVCLRIYLMYLSCLFASTPYNTASTITSRSVQYAHNRISATIGYPLQ